ncbi:MAG: class I SAM-dependent RNA methyltransferase [Clostridia bacterium]|nr:class I SAM-dependent RNA methyltransferase [Clostridia bacterium]
MTHKIAVTSAFGVESVTKKELKNLGVRDPKAIDGSFVFDGTMRDVSRLNVFLRTGDRVHLVLKEFPARSFDELFDGVKSVPFSDYLPTDARIIVNGKSVKSTLYSLSDCQKIIKKAILSRLSEDKRTTYFPESGPTYEVLFSIRNDLVTLSLNTSGKGLHKRGYRDLVGDAPIKETLAAALVALSPIDAERPFVDPFCGSGTLLIEAATAAMHIAPGISRDFDFLHWNFFDKKLYEETIEEAKSGEKKQKLPFAGYDVDPSAIKLALRHAERAGIREYVHLQARDVKDLSHAKSHGCIVTNPPYGERLLTEREALELYKTFGDVCKRLDQWSINVITSAKGFERAFGKKADRNRKLFNANKECRFYQYDRL